ncbi:MAG: MBL fold metallo-hydrolase [Candidatus Njordarchaeia archaeon]
MKIIKMITGPLATCTYIIYDEDTRKGYIIDPGGDGEEILKKVRNLELKIEGVIATHLHIDHFADADFLVEKLNTVFMYNKEEEKVDYDELIKLAYLLGYRKIKIPGNKKYLNEGDKLSLGGEKLKILLTPGHTPGSISLYTPGHIFSGDVIFRDGFGRVDLPGGNMKQLINTIKNKIFNLPDHTVIHPGHGDDTTVGREKKHNLILSIWEE